MVTTKLQLIQVEQRNDNTRGARQSDDKVGHSAWAVEKTLAVAAMMTSSLDMERTKEKRIWGEGFILLGENIKIFQ